MRMMGVMGRGLVLAAVWVLGVKGYFWLEGFKGEKQEVKAAVPAIVEQDKVWLNATLVELEKGYVKAVEEDYLPAKWEAEKNGEWWRVYEVARRIGVSCGLRASWTKGQLDDIGMEPAELPGMKIDWKKKSETAAREVTGCIAVMRGERR